MILALGMLVAYVLIQNESWMCSLMWKKTDLMLFLKRGGLWKFPQLIIKDHFAHLCKQIRLWMYLE